MRTFLGEFGRCQNVLKYPPRGGGQKGGKSCFSPAQLRVTFHTSVILQTSDPPPNCAFSARTLRNSYYLERPHFSPPRGSDRTSPPSRHPPLASGPLGAVTVLSWVWTKIYDNTVTGSPLTKSQLSVGTAGKGTWERLGSLGKI
jgi:hypothetical protein